MLTHGLGRPQKLRSGATQLYYAKSLVDKVVSCCIQMSTESHGMVMNETKSLHLVALI